MHYNRETLLFSFLRLKWYQKKSIIAESFVKNILKMSHYKLSLGTILTSSSDLDTDASLFYLSWWKNPWNICRSLWVCVGHSPAAQWSALCGLQAFSRGEGTEDRQTDTQQMVRQSPGHRPALGVCVGGGLREVRLLQRFVCTERQFSNMATRHHRSCEAFRVYTELAASVLALQDTNKAPVLQVLLTPSEICNQLCNW